MLQYSGSWGHLIMSICLVICGMALIILEPNNSVLQGVGVTLLLGVNGVWIVAQGAKNVPPV